MINSISKTLLDELNVLMTCQRHLPLNQVEKDEFKDYNYNPIEYFIQRAKINSLLEEKLKAIKKASTKLIKKIESTDLKNDVDGTSKIIDCLHSLKIDKVYRKEIDSLYEEKIRRISFNQIQPVAESLGLKLISSDDLLLTLNNFKSFNRKLIEAIKAVYKADKFRLLQILK